MYASDSEKKILENSAGTYTIGTTTFTINEDGTVSVSGSSDTTASVAVDSEGNLVISIGDAEYKAETSDDGSIDTANVKDKDGNAVTVTKKAEEVNNDEKVVDDEGGDASFFTWKAAEDTEFIASTDNITANTVFGEITIGADANNAVQRDSSRIKLPARGWVSSFLAKDGSLNAARVIRFTAPKGAKKITVVAAPASTSTAGNITITDGDKENPKCLATKTLESFEKGTTPPQSEVVVEFDTALEADTYIYVLNLKSGGTTATPSGFTEGSGGTIGIYSISVTGTEKAAQTAPTATDFSVTQPAAVNAKGTITYNGSNIANLQYSSDKTDIRKWGDTAAKEFGAGVVYVRYGSTDEYKASDWTALEEIVEFVDTSLTTPDAPATTMFRATAPTSADGKGSIAVAATEAIPLTALEYKKQGASDYAAVTATIEADGGATYLFRIKAVSGTSNASADTSVYVKKFTAAPSASDFTVTAASSDTAKDGAITAKSAAVVVNLMVVGVGEGGADATWASLAESDNALKVSGLAKGEYQAYYAETATNAASAKGAITVGVKTVFTAFVAADNAISSSDAQKFSASDGTWEISSGKYQTNGWTSYDYNADAGTGYKYEKGRIKVQKDAIFTINSVKGAILRIDGGSTSTGTARTFTITGANETTWAAKTIGSLYITVTADDGVVTLKPDNEFAVHGIHTAIAPATTVAEAKVTYETLTVTLSASECLKNVEVTAKATVKRTIINSTATVYDQTTQDVTNDVTWSGAAVTNGVVTTSSEGTLSITAEYTDSTRPKAIYGDGSSTKLTSEAKTLVISGSFTAATKTYNTTGDDKTDFGLDSVTGVTSSDSTVVTATLAENVITLTSVETGSGKTAKVTVTGKVGDEEKTATINVSVAVAGAITDTVTKYSEAPASATVSFFKGVSAISDTVDYSPTIDKAGLVSVTNATQASNSGAITVTAVKIGKITKSSTDHYGLMWSAGSYTADADACDIVYVTFTVTPTVDCKLTGAKATAVNSGGNENNCLISFGTGTTLTALGDAVKSSSNLATFSKTDLTTAMTAGTTYTVKAAITGTSKGKGKSSSVNLMLKDIELTFEK